MPINSFDTNYQETPCKFKIKATGETIDGYRLDWHDGFVEYMSKSIIPYDKDKVIEIKENKTMPIYNYIKKARKKIKENNIYGFALFDLVDEIKKEIKREYISNNKILNIYECRKQESRLELLLISRLRFEAKNKNTPKREITDESLEKAIEIFWSSDNMQDAIKNSINALKYEEKRLAYRYYYQTEIDKIVNSFRGGAWLIEDEKDNQEIIEHIISYLPKDLQSSSQNVKPFDLDRSIFIARAWQALADKNLIK